MKVWWLEDNNVCDWDFEYKALFQESDGSSRYFISQACAS